MTNNSYQKLVQLSTKAAHYNAISMILGWDQETYMPKGAIEMRSKQNELIAGLVHQEKTSETYRETLGSLIDLETGTVLTPHLSDPQKAALREWRRDYLQTVKLPTSFVEEFAKTTSASMHAWQEAKENNDFKSFQPHLEKVVTLCRKKAELLGYEEHPYDALIDSFEPDMTTKVLTTLFERLKIPLTALLKKIQTKPHPNAAFFELSYPHHKQLSFGKQLLADMGFDKSFSRLDETAHPMCMPIHPNDMRMTTCISPTNLMFSILSCVHEGGHGLYHVNLSKEHFGTPLGESASLAIDESQSRTWETLIGHSLPFWQFYFPKLREMFPENLGDVLLEDFYKAVNLVKPSMIRTDSDEVTYNLHIMVRFELEKALLTEELEVKDLPDAWNGKMREYLGICPQADSEGCLQDIHWSMGAIGYFPTYSLGNLYAAQFFETFAKAHPHWKEEVAKGKFSSLSNWQKQEIHQFGRQYLPEDLCEKVTGGPLSEKPFIAYLENKYTPLYHL
ncbi:MAG: Thermostable carboxypeptidase 1 [Chlamydiae bacterium]|nr:Thermostable carboxypeptidase 1 [Chlamydiota bacterium]